MIGGVVGQTIVGTVCRLETLSISGSWEKIELEDMLPRTQSLACPLSQSQILISGGYSKGGDPLADVAIYDTSLGSYKKVIARSNAQGFLCHG